MTSHNSTNPNVLHKKKNQLCGNLNILVRRLKYFLSKENRLFFRNISMLGEQDLLNGW